MPETVVAVVAQMDKRIYTIVPNLAVLRKEGAFWLLRDRDGEIISVPIQNIYHSIADAQAALGADKLVSERWLQRRLDCAARKQRRKDRKKKRR
jgi:hypothetical protein